MEAKNALGRIPVIMKFCQFILENEDFPDSTGAVTILDCLAKEEVKCLIDKYFEDEYSVVSLSETI
ncbi:hypothetical protein [Sedimentibacter sp. MB31-C6]|uniref:hypothetical protein n=1 Tax=Sedimentibacter sp. MB31-C6 TaxID=3109366 RepID=UPI002DDD1B3E|nr:hypothetical protein [Sedimentibacter sp. MB36-C1]WSI04781.1 hypothetical protein U8307_03065 [Sedimentibacter sp. MB36-C1]